MLCEFGGMNGSDFSFLTGDCHHRVAGCERCVVREEVRRTAQSPGKLAPGNGCGEERVVRVARPVLLRLGGAHKLPTALAKMHTLC